MTEMSTSQRKHFIDFMKGLCALCIIITHFKWTSIQRLYLLFPFWIDMAVPVFMLITGYVYTNSFMRHGVCEFKEAYNTALILQRFKRILLPYIVIFSIEAIIDIAINKATLLNVAIYFFFGGKGPGSYYTPVMIQVILVFPIIYFAIKKFKVNGFILVWGGVNAAYELLYRLAGLPISIYRICVLRYLFFIAFGCCLAMYKKTVFGKTVNRILLCTGVIFIICVEYLGIDPLIVNFDWKRVSYIAGFYIAPLFELIVLREPGVHSLLFLKSEKHHFMFS